MAEVELYTTMYCPYCSRARALLQRKGVAYVDIDIAEEPARRDEMIRRAQGRSTVPQIFINGEHIGGYDDLASLDRAGDLDPKLRITEGVTSLLLPAFNLPLRAIMSPISGRFRIWFAGRATAVRILSLHQRIPG